MIQRIQSIYLSLAAILMAVTAFNPIVKYMPKVGDAGLLYPMAFVGQKGLGIETWGIIFFLGLSILLSLVNIFMYKNRKRQIKIGIATIATIVLFYITAYVYHSSIVAKIETIVMILPTHWLLFPFIALILNILAVIRIRKDEKLVRSLDRIR